VAAAENGVVILTVYKKFTYSQQISCAAGL